MDEKKPIEKSILHKRNIHRFGYDFSQLSESLPELIPFVIVNKFGNESIDFSDKNAVKCLNKALLKHFYGINHWDIPANYLCPPIPGRADYLHYLADLLQETNNGKIPDGNKITVLDIGTGANCVYPLIGNREYNWHFIGSDIDLISIDSAQKIIDANEILKDKINFRLQKSPNQIFNGIIGKDEKIHVTICNPPFHASAEEAAFGTNRKLKNLKISKSNSEKLNFGGQNNELWCEGGEAEFCRKMIIESKEFSKNCLWFTTLVSKKTSLPSIYFHLKKINALEVKTIEMKQGQKISRFVAWTFLTKEEQKKFFSRVN